MKTTVRKISSAITTQKRALDFRASSWRRLLAFRRARSRWYARSTAEGSSEGESSSGAPGRVAGWAIGASLERCRCAVIPASVAGGTDVRRGYGRSDRPKAHTSHRGARLLRGPERSAESTEPSE